MFAVLFEVHPKAEKWDAYLGYAKLLRPELERIDGFVDNICYRSLTREGWLLSLSSWRDEKALVRWRTLAVHHEVQEKGRQQVFLDYHLRVGQLTRDTKLPAGQQLTEQRLDVTEAGAGTAVVLLDVKRPSAVGASAEALASSLGLVAGAGGLIGWDVFDAVLTPGDALLMTAGVTPPRQRHSRRAGRSPPICFAPTSGSAAFGSSATTECRTGGRLHSTTQMHRIGIPLSRRGEKRG
jgi:heme-degrading monooxygenase HmoA